MSYLFGFKGRINRAKIWLFILVAIVWWLAIAAIAIFGLHWSHFIEAVRTFKATVPHVGRPPMPCPDAISGTGWAALGAIVVLVLAYIWAKLAIFVKRLHDRNKSAWWLVPYVLVPLLLSAFVMGSGQWPYFFAGFWVGPMGIARAVAYLVSSLISLWVLIELWFFRGTKGENRFGPDPLAK